MKVGPIAVRLLLAAVALLALGFAFKRIPAELEAEPIISLSERIVAGMDYDPKALERFEPVLATAERDPGCGPSRGPVAAIRTYQVQQAAIETDIKKAQERGRLAIGDIRRKLACAPADGLSWLTLFIMESSLTGKARANIPFLLMSYLVAPNEGQLMRTRAQVATALLPLVGPELQGYIRDEFVHIARDDHLTAITLILGSGEALQKQLLALLEGVSLDQRKQIASRLAYEGSDLQVPGLPKP